MYAVIQDSGRQFKVNEGDVVDVDIKELPADAKTVEFDQVLLVSNEGQIKVGMPLVKGAKVTAEIIDPLHKGEKLYHSYFRRRKHSRRKIGHRQKYLRVKISKITA